MHSNELWVDIILVLAHYPAPMNTRFYFWWPESTGSQENNI